MLREHINVAILILAAYKKWSWIWRNPSLHVERTHIPSPYFTYFSSSSYKFTNKWHCLLAEMEITAIRNIMQLQGWKNANKLQDSTINTSLLIHFHARDGANSRSHSWH